MIKTSTYVKAILKAKGSVSKAAKLLKCSRAHLQTKINTNSELKSTLDSCRYRIGIVDGVKCGQFLLNDLYCVTVDMEDLDKIKQLRWNLKDNNCAPTISGISKDNKHTTLGRFLLNPPANSQVIVINGDVFDHRKSNLKITSGIFHPVKNKCKSCGVSFTRINHRQNNNYTFCSKQCTTNWQKNDLTYRIKCHINGKKSGGKNKIYTNSMLRRFLEWEGTNCAFPQCSELKGRINKWHLCKLHNSRLNGALQSQKKEYERKIKQYAGSYQTSS